MLELAVVQQFLFVAVGIISALWIWKSGIPQALFGANRDLNALYKAREEYLNRELELRLAENHRLQALTHDVRVGRVHPDAVYIPAPKPEKPQEPDTSIVYEDEGVQKTYKPQSWA